MTDFVCPNGHEFPSFVAVECGQCDASVTCEPVTRGMALMREIERLRICVAAALERVEVMDGAADGNEAEAILHEALDGRAQ